MSREIEATVFRLSFLRTMRGNGIFLNITIFSFFSWKDFQPETVKWFKN